MLLAIGALAQNAGDGPENNGFLINFIQERISAPGRQISLQGVSGALSSRARIEGITISDDQGPWLRLRGVEIDWSRRRLLLGQLVVSRLVVDRIEYLRKAVPPETSLVEQLPPPEAKPFSLPELPVSVRVDEIDLRTIDIAQAAFGKAAVLSANGRLTLADGALDSALNVTRTDGPGGALELAVAFANQTRVLDLNLGLQEPQGGVVATLLDIEGQPAIDLTLAGSGPIEQLDVDFAFDAGGARIADGRVELRGGAEGLGFVADFQGGLSPVVPAPYRDFFAGETTIDVSGVSLAAGGLRLDQVAVRGSALDLTGALQTTPDGFARSLTLDGRIGDPEGAPVTLPVPGAATTLQSGVVSLDYGESQRWTGRAALDRLATGTIAIEDLTLDLGGLATALEDPAQRNVTIAATGAATGVSSENPDIDAALGSRLDLFADVALPPGGGVTIRQAQLSDEGGLALFIAGRLDGLDFDGRFAAKATDIASASGLLGRDLGGSIDVTATGTVQPLDGAFDLDLNGAAQDLRLGDPRLDGLLAGETSLSGGLARTIEGIRADSFRLANPQVEITSTGRLSSGRTDLALNAALTDLAAIDPRLSGGVTLSGRASGQGRPVGLTLEIAAPAVEISGQPLADARLSFDGQLATDVVSGAVRGTAQFAGQPIVVNADLDLGAQSKSVTNLVAQVAQNRLTGGVAQTNGAPIEGALDLDAPDVSPLAQLLLAEATGAVDATIRLFAADVGQGADVEAEVRDLVVGGARLRALDLEAAVSDAFGTPLVNGDFTISDLSAGGFDVTSLNARARQTGSEAMEVTADAALANGTLIDAAGGLARLPGGLRATIDRLALRQGDVTARLTDPATITVANGAANLTPLALEIGGGRLTAQGDVAENLDLTLGLENLPLSVANAIRPSLGLDGTLDGSARVTGPRGAPDVRFNVTGERLAAAATAQAGLPPASLSATGRTEGEQIRVEAAVTAEGVDLRANGAVPMGDGPLSLDVALAAFPVALLDRIAGGQGLAGGVTGSTQVRGTIAAPTVAFDLVGSGLTARPLQQNGVSALGASARGAFARNVVTLQSVTLRNDQGLEVEASGRIPLARPGLDVHASGVAPLSLADAFLVERTAQASGAARFDLTARGALRDPQLAGSVAIENGAFYDPQTNVRLQGVTADAALNGRTITLRAFRAGVTAGGEITAQGTVSLEPGYPANLATRFNRVRYTDGSFVTTQLDGELRAEGPLIGGGGIVSGRIDLGRTEISVAEGLGAGASAILDQVAHVATPPGVQQTLDRAKVGLPRERPAPRSGASLRTNVLIRAPNQIFVRGRGLDVELGGQLTITGPIDDIVPVGQFQMRRGRLELLGQRIQFDEGVLRLTGNLDPEINFVASTRSQDVTAYITVTGRVSAPDVAFTSQPSLPQDEVLARIIFNRSVSDLSPFQIAQLASAAAELAGAGSAGGGIMGALRNAIGVDDLDVITEENGETAVRAGAYIDDNIYLDVQADQEGETRAQINLDVTDALTLRGSVGSDGNSTLGVFFERDY